MSVLGETSLMRARKNVCRRTSLDALIIVFNSVNIQYRPIRAVTSHIINFLNICSEQNLWNINKKYCKRAT